MSIANIEISRNKKLKKSYFFNECNNVATNFACTEELPVTTGTIWLKLEQDITTPTGRSSEPQIKILSLIVSWCQYNKAMVWRTSYSYLSKTLKRSVDAIRKNITALHNKGLIVRTIKHAIVDGRMRPNVMFLELTEKTIKLLQTVSTGKPSSRQKRKDINNTNNNFLNNRSTKSNFCKKNSSNATEDLIRTDDTTNLSEKTSLSIHKKSLADFSELSEEDYDALRKLSGRNFSNDGISQILTALIHKCKHTVFTVKRAFLSYVAKCLYFELRSEEQVNDANFRCLVKPSKEEQMQKRQEQYLTEVECSTSTDIEQIFKKQVARNFSSSRAYQILTALRGMSTTGHRVTLEISKEIGLEVVEREKLIKIASGVHAESYMKEHKIGLGELIGNALTNYYSDGEEEQLIPELTELVIDVKELKTNTNTLVKSGSNSNNTAKTLTNSEEHLQLFNKFADWFDEAIAKSWFSTKQFQISCDHEQKTITARARTSFIFYHFKDHYQRCLETITKQLFTGYEFILQGVVA